MKNKFKLFIDLHPVMSFLLLTVVVVVISLIFSLVNAQATYNEYAEATGNYAPVTESVQSLFNFSGIRYIFSTSVASFANFTVLSNLIIILIGIGILDKSGFLLTSVTLLTKRAKKTSVTFTIILLLLLSSIIGDLAYIVFIPLTALFFYYGKRNPLLGVVISFGALSVGSGISIFFTAIDSFLRDITLSNAKILQSYDFSINSLIFVNIIAVVGAAFLLTYVTENYISKKLPKYDFPEADLEEDIVTRRELRAMVLSVSAGILYIIIIVYNITPGLPLSGNFLDNSQELYIDKLFSYESFFSSGFVFIVTMFLIILGLVYGLVSKSIKNSKDVVENLGSALDGIGKTLLLIFVASLLINIFTETNIGSTFTVFLVNILSNSGFTGLPLVLLLFLITILATLLLPSSIAKWPIMASVAVPAFMEANLTPEFAQIVFRFGESVSTGLTPLFAYFIVYLAYLEKYNQHTKSIGIMKSIRLQLPYSLIMLGILLIIIILFFVTNVPLGFDGSIVL